MKVILFPGQGSQKIGMGRFYYDNFPLAKKLFEEAEDTLKINFKKLCFEGPEEELTKTQNTQPAIVLVSSVAWLCLSEEIDLKVKYCAGHSVGEYSALVCAGVLNLNTALKVVRERGLAMSQSKKGSMSALVGPSSEEAKSFCHWVREQSGELLETANFNSPTQTVLSGSTKALLWAGENYKRYSFSAEKIRLIPLKVSAAFHCLLMESARQKMSEVLKDISFQPANKAVVQNISAKAETEPTVIKKNLVEQVKAPVLWIQSMEYLLQKGCDQFLELGEGKVLAGLMKKISSEQPVLHFHSLEDLQTLKIKFNKKS